MSNADKIIKIIEEDIKARHREGLAKLHEKRNIIERLIENETKADREKIANELKKLRQEFLKLRDISDKKGYRARNKNGYGINWSNYTETIKISIDDYSEDKRIKAIEKKKLEFTQKCDKLIREMQLEAYSTKDTKELYETFQKKLKEII